MGIHRNSNHLVSQAYIIDTINNREKQITPPKRTDGKEFQAAISCFNRKLFESFVSHEMRRPRKTPMLSFTAPIGNDETVELAALRKLERRRAPSVRSKTP